LSRLTITAYADDAPGTVVVRTEEPQQIAAELSRTGVRFQRWDSPVDLDANAAPDAVLVV